MCCVFVYVCVCAHVWIHKYQTISLTCKYPSSGFAESCNLIIKDLLLHLDASLMYGVKYLLLKWLAHIHWLLPLPVYRYLRQVHWPLWSLALSFIILWGYSDNQGFFPHLTIRYSHTFWRSNASDGLRWKLRWKMHMIVVMIGVGIKFGEALLSRLQ